MHESRVTLGVSDTTGQSVDRARGESGSSVCLPTLAYGNSCVDRSGKILRFTRKPPVIFMGTPDRAGLPLAKIKSVSNRLDIRWQARKSVLLDFDLHRL